LELRVLVNLEKLIGFIFVDILIENYYLFNKIKYEVRIGESCVYLSGNINRFGN